MRRAPVRIGISGWRYARWRGTFYPRELVQRDELAYASRCFDSIEINGSFYSLQRPESYARWYEAAPRGFVFAVKCPRFITHIRRLREIEAPLANFFASGVLTLGAKLGPLLWQCPPSLRYDAERWENFLAQLPHNTLTAAHVARRDRDDRLGDRVDWRIDRNRRLRHAVEVRHESFRNAEFVAQLRRHRVALVIADAARRWPYFEDVTADFVYLRLHGAEELYASGYDAAALRGWERRIREWNGGGEPCDAKRHAPPAAKRTSRAVYCYFDNDAKVRAPFDAAALRERLGLPWRAEARRLLAGKR